MTVAIVWGLILVAAVVTQEIRERLHGMLRQSERWQRARMFAVNHVVSKA